MLLNVILNLDKDLLTHVQLLTAESSKARRRKTEVMWYTNLLDLVYPNYFFTKKEIGPLSAPEAWLGLNVTSVICLFEILALIKG